MLHFNMKVVKVIVGLVTYLKCLIIGISQKFREVRISTVAILENRYKLLPAQLKA